MDAKIKGQARFKFPDAIWGIVGQICNKTDREITTIVTDNPLDKDGKKFFDENDTSKWERRTVTLAPGQCTTVSFPASSGGYKTEPKGCYMDTYKNEEDLKVKKRDDGKRSSDIFAQAIRPGTENPFVFTFPFPAGSAGYVTGSPGRFVMGIDLQDLPPDWRLLSITPSPGEKFSLAPSEYLAIRGELSVPKLVPEGTFANIRMDFHDADSGQWLVQGGQSFVYDHEPPRITRVVADLEPVHGAVRFVVTAEDQASTILATWVRYSTDGRQWSIVGLRPILDKLTFNRVGAGVTEGTFEETVEGLEPGHVFYYQAIAMDQMENIAMSEKNTFTISPRRTD